MRRNVSFRMTASTRPAITILGEKDFEMFLILYISLRMMLARYHFPPPVTVEHTVCRRGRGVRAVFAAHRLMYFPYGDQLSLRSAFFERFQKYLFFFLREGNVIS